LANDRNIFLGYRKYFFEKVGNYRKYFLSYRKYFFEKSWPATGIFFWAKKKVGQLQELFRPIKKKVASYRNYLDR
jgi:hypothetical protein